MRFWVLLVLCGILPDLDAIGLRMGVAYGGLWGHRGLTHSLPFAAIVSLLVVCLAFRGQKLLSPRWWALWAMFFLVMVAHDVLDAMTDGGLGVAFFSPFDTTRYFLPWRPLAVSPIGLRCFLTNRGLHVILNECLWVWVPMTLLWSAVVLLSIGKGGAPDES